MNRPSILIVEDEAIVALELRLQLQDLGYAVAGVAASGEEAIAAVAQSVPQLILMDVRLQGQIDGIAAAESIRVLHDVPLIFLTSYSDDDTVQRAARTGAYGYLTKPYQIRELRAGIEVALTKSRMERQLREADRWFAHTLQCVADAVIVTDLQACVRFLNPAAEQITGWPQELAVGRHIDDVVCLEPAGDAAVGAAVGASGGASSGAAAADSVGRLASEHIRHALREGRPAPVAHALKLLRRGGGGRVVDQTAGPVDDDAGKRLGAVLVLRDAEPRIAQEVRLRASEERFRSAFDYAPLGMALVSFAGGFIQVNDALCRLLGGTRETLCRHGNLGLTPEAERSHEAQRLRQLDRHPGEVVQFEKHYRRLNHGDLVSTLVSVSLLRDGAAAACHLYQVHDLTEQKRSAEQLAELAHERVLREASELASQSKSEFLSRVSHEMRTPLNAVIGFAQLLQLQRQATLSLAEAQLQTQTYAGHIRVAGQHLLALVTDLLDLNRVAQGTLKLSLAPVQLRVVVQEALTLLQATASEHGIALDVRVPAGLMVNADELRLRQVVLNVVSNAVKYSLQGGSVSITAGAGEPGHVALMVKDQGIGMTTEQLGRLFQPFERLGAERTKIPGTGLGLVIARSMVVEMGGSLALTSAPREGTTVTLQLRQIQ